MGITCERLPTSTRSGAMAEPIAVPVRTDIAGRVARKIGLPRTAVTRKVAVVVRHAVAITDAAAQPGYGLAWAPVLFVNPSLTMAALLVTPGKTTLAPVRWNSIAAMLSSLPACGDKPMACAYAPPTLALSEAFMYQVMWAAALRHVGAQRSARDVLKPAAKRLSTTLRANVIGNPVKELRAVLGFDIADDGTADICAMLGKPVGVHLVRQLNRGPDSDDPEVRTFFGPAAVRLCADRPGRVQIKNFWAALSFDAVLSLGLAMASDPCWAAVFEDSGPRLYSGERQKIASVLATARKARANEVRQFGGCITLDNAPLCITAALRPDSEFPKHQKRFTLGVIISTAISLADTDSPLKKATIASIVRERFAANGWNDGEDRGKIVSKVITSNKLTDKRPCCTYRGFCPFGGNVEVCAKDMGLHTKVPADATAAHMWALNAKQTAGDAN